MSVLDEATDATSWQSRLAAVIVAADGEDFIVGRPDLGIFVSVPEPGAVLLAALQAGASLVDATERASTAAGEAVDGADFLAGLADAGLLAEGTATEVSGLRLRWLERVPSGIVRPFFGPAAWAVYAAALFGAMGMLMARPDLRPSFEDIWFLNDPLWSLLAGIPVSIVLTAGHESWHWFAARALGVPARFRMSRRGLFLVCESDLSQLVTIPRRRRYSPMLAGMAFDTVILSASLGLRLGFREEVLFFPPLLDRALGMLIIRQVAVLVWQLFAVAWRSDGYAVLANLLHCQNLYRATWLTTKSRVWRVTSDEVDELAGVNDHDLSVASWFALVYLLGGFAMVGLLMGYAYPFTLGMVRWVRPNIADGGVGTLAFWQSLVFVVIVTAQLLAVPAVEVWERRLRRAGRLS